MDTFQKNLEIIKIQIENIKDQRKNIWLGLLASFGGLGALFPTLPDLKPMNLMLFVIIMIALIMLFIFMKDDNNRIIELIKRLEESKNEQ